MEGTTTAIPAGRTVAPARLGGAGMTPEDREFEKNLHMMYVEVASLRSEGLKVQFVVFPPEQGVLSSTEDYENTMMIFKSLERRQEFKGNRARWKVKQCSGKGLGDILSSYLSSMYWDSTEMPQWEVNGPIIVPLELDDYHKLTVDSEVPHKALRAVDRELVKHGLSLK